MKQLIFSTDYSWTGLILRLISGFIMLPHGLQKMFGLFGGYGFNNTMNYFTSAMKLPWIISALVIFIEMFCSVGLIIGLGTRVCAALFVIIMAGAIITINYKNGFFMNWFGSQAGEGFEYHLLFIGICIALIITGGGRFALDNLIG